MKACKNVNRYKGLRAPTCNGGDPCDACREKFRTVVADNGTKFRLHKTFMVALGDWSEKNPHKGFRNEIARAFQGHFDVHCTRKGLVGYENIWSVSHNPQTLFVRIGCMKFSGISYVKLKNWAIS